MTTSTPAKKLQTTKLLTNAREIQVGDRVTDGDLSGTVWRVGKIKAQVRHYGQGLQDGKIVLSWFYLSSLTLVRKVSAVKAAV